ncbi:hypothetical protein [Halorussus sp. MSC15.2]|uniref:hypothetical protein n=1 Tax=Halorussus sp. MSC15.2 TaxID=2283638 RepID=UPI0013D5055F|nr:hypothetical protein [Halorussus sp. MSC15.2]NEU58399.1 hypothetical protein [Halorussus sp. MSC15.2]
MTDGSVIMPSSRRTFLTAVGTGLTVGLSGCTDAGNRPVSLSVSNLTQESYSLFIEILPADIEQDLSEKQLFAEWIDVGRDDEAYTERENVFDAVKALVRVKNESGYICEYTFVPDCPDSETGEHIEITLVSENTATVTQNWCRT